MSKDQPVKMNIFSKLGLSVTPQQVPELKDIEATFRKCVLEIVKGEYSASVVCGDLSREIYWYESKFNKEDFDKLLGLLEYVVCVERYYELLEYFGVRKDRDLIE